MSILLLFDAGPIPSGSYAITDHANTSVVHIGSGVHTITKSANDGSFNASAVSSVGLTGDFVLRVKSLLINGGIYLGMNSDPLADNTEASIDFAWNNPFSVLGNIRESGALIASGLGSSDYHWIWRVGTTLGYGRGPDIATAQASPDRTVPGTSGTLYFDSSFLAIGDKAEVLLSDIPAAVSYTLTADQGSFSYTGQTANLLVGTVLAASTGTFSYTGQAANLQRGYIMAAAQATFSYTGQAAGLLRGYNLAAAFGSFSYNGQTANLKAAYLLPAAVGVFTYTGQDALLERGYIMPASAGSYVYNGQAAAFHLGGTLFADAGAFTYNGQAVVLRVSVRITADPGLFTYTGQPARATISVGSFTFSGGSVGARVSGGFFR